MGINEPLPGQLTVRKLKEPLSFSTRLMAHFRLKQDTLVVLLIRKTVEVPAPFYAIALNLRVTRRGGALFAFEPEDDVLPPVDETPKRFS